MATYHPSYDPYGAERRARRDLELHWGAIFGGTIAGWGLFLLLSLFGTAAGLAVVRPYTARPWSSLGTGPAIWTAAAMLLSSVAGAFLMVRLAGERRSRSGRMEAIIAWGLSMIAGAVLALGVASTADGAGAAAGGSLLSLFGALGGATIAARSRSGRAICLPFHWRANRKDRADVPGDDLGNYDGGDEPTILPPTH